MKLAVLTTTGVGLLTACVVASLWIPTSLEVVSTLVESREEQMLSTSKDVADKIQMYFQKASSMTAVLEHFWENALAVAPNAPVQYMIRTYGLAMYHYLLENPELNSCFVVTERNPKYVNSMCDVDGWLFSTSYLSEMLNTTTGRDFNDCPVGSTQSCANKVRLAAIAGAKNITHPMSVVGTIFDVDCDKWLLGSTYSMTAGNLTRKANATWHGITEPVWSWAYPDVAGTYPRQSILHAVWRPISFPTWPISKRRIAFAQCSIRLSRISVNAEKSESVSSMLERTARQVGLSATLLVVSFKREVVATSIANFAPERVLSNGEITGLKHFSNETLPSAVRKVGHLINQLSCSMTPCDFSLLPETTRHAGHLVSFVPVSDPMATELGLLVVMMVPVSEIESPSRSLAQKLAFISAAIFVVACLGALGFGMMVAHPISTFQVLLIQAAALRGLDEIYDMKQTSIVSEIRVMKESLRTLVGALMEYRGFIPAAMIDQTSSDETVEETTPSKGSRCISDGSSLSSELSSPRQMQQMGLRLSLGLVTRHVSVACINVRDWNKLVRGKGLSSDDVAKQITLMLAVLKGCMEKGTIDRFNGDRFMVTWNAGPACRDRIDLSAQSCYMAAEALQKSPLSAFPPSSVGLSVCSGSVMCGSVGIDTVRAHNVVGPPVTSANVLCDLASVCATDKPIVLADSSAGKLTRIVAVPVGMCNHISGLRSDRLVFEVLGSRGVSDQEWMYMFDESSDCSRFGLLVMDFLAGKAVSTTLDELKLIYQLRLRQHFPNASRIHSLGKAMDDHERFVQLVYFEDARKRAE
eukprot:Sspe_Gene.22637::Locus_8636_Transcript_1_2_Confidence_0.500_Length_2896::g.22637::m.22637